MFSKNLKDLRLKANLTQVQIAQELDITQQSYQKWESGKSKPTLSTLEMFSDFFKSFSSNEKFIEKYSILKNGYLERLIDTIGSTAFANVKISFYNELIGLLLEFQSSQNDF